VSETAAPARAPLLERRISRLDASALVVGSVIGSGIYIVSAEAARVLGSPGWLLLTWAAAVAVAFA